jgi:hypothetical protein
MSMVAVMHEYRISSDTLGMFRIPHVVRSVIQQTPAHYNATKYQHLLRNLIVQHVLATAFRAVHGIDKRSLVSVLMKLRDVAPFATIRSMLENSGVILAHPSEANEKTAERLCRAIIARIDNSAVNEELNVVERAIFCDPRDVAKDVALRAVGNIDARIYEKTLYRLFPELDPRYSKPRFE